MRISDWSSDVCSSDLTAFLDVARGPEETRRRLKRIGVDAAGQNLARRGNDGVVGAAEARDRIEQDDDILLVLDETLGLFDHHFGDLDVARRGLVEGRGDDFAVHAALHVGDFLGPFVDQQDRSEEHTSELPYIMSITYAV